MKVMPTIIGLWLHPKNTLTHSAAMERLSTSVLKSLQSRGVNIKPLNRMDVHWVAGPFQENNKKNKTQEHGKHKNPLDAFDLSYK